MCSMALTLRINGKGKCPFLSLLTNSEWNALVYMRTYNWIFAEMKINVSFIKTGKSVNSIF